VPYHGCREPTAETALHIRGGDDDDDDVYRPIDCQRRRPLPCISPCSSIDLRHNRISSPAEVSEDRRRRSMLSGRSHSPLAIIVSDLIELRFNVLPLEDTEWVISCQPWSVGQYWETLYRTSRVALRSSFRHAPSRRHLSLNSTAAVSS